MKDILPFSVEDLKLENVCLVGIIYLLFHDQSMIVAVADDLFPYFSVPVDIIRFFFLTKYLFLIQIISTLLPYVNFTTCARYAMYIRSMIRIFIVAGGFCGKTFHIVVCWGESLCDVFLSQHFVDFFT